MPVFDLVSSCLLNSSARLWWQCPLQTWQPAPAQHTHTGHRPAHTMLQHSTIHPHHLQSEQHPVRKYKRSNKACIFLNHDLSSAKNCPSDCIIMRKLTDTKLFMPRLLFLWGNLWEIWISKQCVSEKEGRAYESALLHTRCLFNPVSLLSFSFTSIFNSFPTELCWNHKDYLKLQLSKF